MPALRKMLGKADSPYIVALVSCIETQSKTTIVNWCTEYTRQYFLPIYERHYNNDTRPREALDAAKDWLNGKIKLPEAKLKILACHQSAREAENNPVAQATARAVGQASSSIHVATHSLGMAFYGAAAIAYDTVGLNETAEVYDKIAQTECEKMLKALQAVSVENEPNPAKINWCC